LLVIWFLPSSDALLISSDIKKTLPCVHYSSRLLVKAFDLTSSVVFVLTHWEKVFYVKFAMF